MKLLNTLMIAAALLVWGVQHATAAPRSAGLQPLKSATAGSRSMPLRLGAGKDPQPAGCKSNYDGCSRTLANLACGGGSWDPDGDGNYTCKPKKD